MPLVDTFNRNINYLRVSVTDRCNLRCHYCMPAKGIELISHRDILRFEEIIDFIRVAVKLGIDKVRLTGGEPLVRKKIVDLVGSIAEIPGIADFSMTTNGTLLSEFAKPLYNAGLHRLNISMDTIDPEKFTAITRRGDIRDVLEGIQTARKVGFTNIKINCVIQETPTESDAQSVARYAAENGLKIRFIRQMDLEAGQYWTIEGGTGGDCKICNRIRLMSDGKIKPCLVNDMIFDIRKLGAAEAIRQAVLFKPQKGKFSQKHRFYSIGG